MIFREGGRPNIPDFGNEKPTEDEIAMAAEAAYQAGREDLKKAKAEANADEYQLRATGKNPVKKVV